jgi:hypothetical protein
MKIVTINCWWILTEEQCEFCKGSFTDTVFTLKNITEKRREFNLPALSGLWTSFRQRWLQQNMFYSWKLCMKYQQIYYIP